MGMQRMFTMTCDGPSCFDAIDGGEWYADAARRRAQEEGWHVSGNYAICAACWDKGVRMAAVRANPGGFAFTPPAAREAKRANR